MRRTSVSIFIAIILGISFSFSALAQDPIKWSAPRNQYPNQWQPTAPAPSQYYGNQQGYYQDPYAYWYGGYQNWGPPQPGFSGNPYRYYYGQ